MADCFNNGGPAFPEAIAVSPSGDVYPGMGGMTLRDYFAGQALASMDSKTKDKIFVLAERAGLDVADVMASSSYEIADAMLKAREVKP